MTQTANCPKLEISFCPHRKTLFLLYRTESDWDFQGFRIKANKYNFNCLSTPFSVQQIPKMFYDSGTAVSKLPGLPQEIKGHVSRQRGQQLLLFRRPVQGTLLQFQDVLNFSHSYSFTNTLYWKDFLQVMFIWRSECHFISVTNTLHCI